MTDFIPTQEQATVMARRLETALAAMKRTVKHGQGLTLVARTLGFASSNAMTAAAKASPLAGAPSAAPSIRNLSDVALLSELRRRGIAAIAYGAEDAADAIDRAPSPALRRWFEDNQRWIQECMKEAADTAVRTYTEEDRPLDQDDDAGGWRHGDILLRRLRSLLKEVHAAPRLAEAPHGVAIPASTLEEMAGNATLLGMEAVSARLAKATVDPADGTLRRLAADDLDALAEELGLAIHFAGQHRRHAAALARATQVLTEIHAGPSVERDADAVYLPFETYDLLWDAAEAMGKANTLAILREVPVVHSGNDVVKEVAREDMDAIAQDFGVALRFTTPAAGSPGAARPAKEPGPLSPHEALKALVTSVYVDPKIRKDTYNGTVDLDPAAHAEMIKLAEETGFVAAKRLLERAREGRRSGVELRFMKQADMDIVAESIGLHCRFALERIVEGGLLVEFSYDGEGRAGDYNPADPDDLPLVRFSMATYDQEGDGTEGIEWMDDASYCSLASLHTPVASRRTYLRRLHAAVAEALQNDCSVKAVCERFTWLDPNGL